jgi:hypothetical protein
MAQRILQIDTIDLDVVPNFEVDSIRADNTPSRDVAKYNLAWEDGSKIVNAVYRDKKIFAFCHIAAGTLEGYENARDTLLGLLHSNTPYLVTIEQSGGFRRYYCIHETTSFEYKGNGFGVVIITFDTTLPFGEEPTYTTPIDEEGVTVPFESSLPTLGSIYTPARVFIKINSIDPNYEERTFTIINTTQGKAYQIEVTRVWSTDDTILIDGAQQKVFVNDGQYAYTGRFPVLYGTNSIQVFDDADSRDIDIKVQYNRRYL